MVSKKVPTVNAAMSPNVKISSIVSLKVTILSVWIKYQSVKNLIDTETVPAKTKKTNSKEKGF